jgi:hypothetical protein
LSRWAIAMIRFACPVCGAVLSVDDNRAGRKAPCPKCGQRLQVPFAVRNKTVLGKPVAAGGIGDAQAPEPSSPPEDVTYTDPPRRRKWLAPLLVAGLFVLGCLGAALLGLGLLSHRPSKAGGSSHEEQEARDSSHTGDAAGSDEQKVRAWIIDHADDPKSVEFVSWGPHDLKGELRAMAEKQRTGAGPFVFFNPVRDMIEEADKVLRVRYRAKNRLGATQLYDSLVFMGEHEGATLGRGKVAVMNNDLGDDWLQTMRKLLAPPPRDEP